jgi:hypothetical protein
VTLYQYYNGDPAGAGDEGSIEVRRTKDCGEGTEGWCVEKLPGY